MEAKDENTLLKLIKNFIYMTMVFFLIVLMVASSTIAIIFALKKKSNTCTWECDLEGKNCICSKCNSGCDSETLNTKTSNFENKTAGTNIVGVTMSPVGATMSPGGVTMSPIGATMSPGGATMSLQT